MRLAVVHFLITAAVLALAWAGIATAQTQPLPHADLHELNRQTTELYRQAQTGIYRVQLPQPRWGSAFALAAMTRWDKQLDPILRNRLESASLVPVAIRVQGAAPTTRPAGPDSATIPGRGTYISVATHLVQDAPQDPVLGGAMQLEAPSEPGFAPTHIGLLLDDQGHVLVPLCVEAETMGDAPVKVSGPDGVLALARFVGSDRPTNLTLLQIDKPSGAPVKLGTSKPEPGSLVLCLASDDGSGRLRMWTDGADDNGIILSTDGQVAGIARFGQFLTGSACKLIARKLMRDGAVKRPTLGVLITEIRQDDPLRRQKPVLGMGSAMRVDQVMPGSAAERAGLRAGDLVLSVGGEPVGDIPSFAAAIASGNADTRLQVLRGDKNLQLTVDLRQAAR